MIPLKKLLSKNEFYVSVVIIFLIILIQAKSGQFFTPNNLVDLARSCILPGILTLGVMMEITASSIDVSFPAIAMLTMYSVTAVATDTQYTGPVWILFVIAGIMGTLLGTVNGVLAAWLKLPTLIITLATSKYLSGSASGSIKMPRHCNYGKAVEERSDTYLFIATNKQSGLSSPLPILFLLLIFVIVIVGFLRKYTMLGEVSMRSEEIEIWHRTGINTAFSQIFVILIYGHSGRNRRPYQNGFNRLLPTNNANWI